MLQLPRDADGVPRLDVAQQHAALALAHSAILAGLGGQAPLESGLARWESNPLFVTLRTPGGALRGCVGHTETQHVWLGDEVAACAVGAAFRDRRFPPLEKHEAAGLDLHISLLGAMQQVASLDALDPAHFGIVVQQGIKRGVMLPAVPGVETVARQLEAACGKAQLWGDEGLRVWRYRVFAFGDQEAGHVV